MILERKLQCSALLADDVIDTLDNIADCKVHSVSFCEPLSQLSGQLEELPLISPLAALLYEVSEQLTGLHSCLIRA